MWVGLLDDVGYYSRGEDRWEVGYYYKFVDDDIEPHVNFDPVDKENAFQFEGGLAGLLHSFYDFYMCVYVDPESLTLKFASCWEKKLGLCEWQAGLI